MVAQLRWALLLVGLLAGSAAYAAWPGGGRYNACLGAACTSFTVSGPSAGPVGGASSPFTVTLSTGTFSGTQTITISDGGAGGTITPSVGASGGSPRTVTPAASATGFTFTYTSLAAGTVTLTFTNAQGWTNAAPLTYMSPTGGCVQGALQFNGACTTVWLQNGIISP